MMATRFACPLLLAFLLAVWIAPEAGAHKFYAALTRLHYNEATGNLEAVHRFFDHDLLVALRAQAGDYLEMDHEVADTAAESWLTTHFQLLSDGRLLEGAYLGHEVQGNLIFLYVEYPLDAPPASLTIRNAMLMDIFPAQFNTVNISGFGDVGTLHFNRGEMEQSLDLANPGT